eukprot:7388411-Prymnesium_polylepis.2
MLVLRCVQMPETQTRRDEAFAVRCLCSDAYAPMPMRCVHATTRSHELRPPAGHPGGNHDPRRNDTKMGEASHLLQAPGGGRKAILEGVPSETPRLHPMRVHRRLTPCRTTS